LTVDSARRTERALAAAQASFQAGAFDVALDLLTASRAGSLDQVQHARASLLRGYVSLASGDAAAAAELLLTAAVGLESSDLEMARNAYVAAWGAGFMAAGDSGDGDILVRICRAVQALPRATDAPRALDLLLEGLSLLVTEGHGAASTILQRAAALLTSIRVEQVLRWGWVATGASIAIWDYTGFLAICERQVQLIRNAGAVAQLPLHLGQLSQARAWQGDFAEAATLIAESASVAVATGTRFPPSAPMRLLALQGKEAEASVAIATQIEQATAVGQAMPAAYWAAAVLYNGLGRYQEAAAAARTRVFSSPGGSTFSTRTGSSNPRSPLGSWV
jgi:tetratricopeptide (TPR) repeat protein